MYIFEHEPLLIRLNHTKDMQIRKSVKMEGVEIVDVNEIISQIKSELAEKILEKPKLNMGYVYANHARRLTRNEMVVELTIKVKGKLIRPHINTKEELKQAERYFQLHYPELAVSQK